MFGKGGVLQKFFKITFGFLWLLKLRCGYLKDVLCESLIITLIIIVQIEYYKNQKVYALGT